MFKWVKRILVLVIALVLVAGGFFAYNLAKHGNTIKDAKNAGIVLEDGTTMEDIMNTMCTDVKWEVVEVTDDITYLDVDGKLKGEVPFLDGYEGAPIGFTVQLKYNELDEVESITLVDARFEESEFDIDYDMDWMLALIYQAYSQMERVQ